MVGLQGGTATAAVGEQLRVAPRGRLDLANDVHEELYGGLSAGRHTGQLNDLTETA